MIVSVGFAVLLLLSFAEATSLRSNTTARTPEGAFVDLQGEESNQVDEERRLDVDDFVPLSCNNVISNCNSWTTIFGSVAEHTSKIIVPCGTCVTMDHPGPELTLQDGIDIQGKLVFPDNYSITLRTTSIVVQGELDMTSTKVVDGTPNIQIIMIGDNSLQKFTPVGENAGACGGDCVMGKKAIVVAGGKVDRKYSIVTFEPAKSCRFIVLNPRRFAVEPGDFYLTLSMHYSLYSFICSQWFAFRHPVLGSFVRCCGRYIQQPD
jgi:hypothetical protein